MGRRSIRLLEKDGVVSATSGRSGTHRPAVFAEVLAVPGEHDPAPWASFELRADNPRPAPWPRLARGTADTIEQLPSDLTTDESEIDLACTLHLGGGARAPRAAR